MKVVTQGQCFFGSCREILEQVASTSSLATISVDLHKTVESSMVRNLSCSTCVNSVPLHPHFSLFCYPGLFMFPLPPNSAYVVIGGVCGHSYH